MNNLCTVESPAVVKWDLSSIAESVKDDCSSALSIAPCIANLPSLKTARAQLNSDHKRIDLDLSAMKTLYMKPWEDFKSEYEDKITAEYRNADEVLKAEINEIEGILKDEKKAEVLDHIEAVTGERNEAYLPKITLSASMKSLIEQADALIFQKANPPKKISRLFTITATPAEMEIIKQFAVTNGIEMKEEEDGLDF